MSLFLPGLGVTAMQFICCKNESIVSTLLICAFGMGVVLCCVVSLASRGLELLLP